MKLEKAIEIKEIYYNGGEIPGYSDYRKADNLSIEALKRMKSERDLWGFTNYPPMPGETKD